jgi:hypothetical protein
VRGAYVCEGVLARPVEGSDEYRVCAVPWAPGGAGEYLGVAPAWATGGAGEYLALAAGTDGGAGEYLDVGGGPVDCGIGRLFCRAGTDGWLGNMGNCSGCLR